MSLSRTYQTSLRHVRSFSSTSNCRAGPESPNYIHIPRTLQPGLPRRPPVKGTLPIPREIFPRRRPDKATVSYIEDATPLPKKPKPIASDDPYREKKEFRRRMADARRRNLAEGLKELYRRKERTDSLMIQQSSKAQLLREKLQQQPPRDDELFTNSSIVQAMQLANYGGLPDPNRETRIAAAKARVESITAEKKSKRQAALHTLYMNARDFIITEEQLAVEIEKTFPKGENLAWRSDHQPGENVWNLGVPPSVQSIVSDSKKKEAVRWDIYQGRVKKLAEELSGGKL